MRRQTKALVALSNFEPPEAHLGELTDEMNMLWPHHILNPLEAVHVRKVMGALKTKQYVEIIDVEFYRLTPAGEAALPPRFKDEAVS